MLIKLLFNISYSIAIIYVWPKLIKANKYKVK